MSTGGLQLTPYLVLPHPILFLFLLALLHSFVPGISSHCYVVQRVSQPTELASAWPAFLTFLSCILALSVIGNAPHHYVVRMVSVSTMHN